MYVFKKIKDENNVFDISDVEITVHDEANLSDLLEQFERFLQASGFGFEGSIDIVEEEN